jgi:predicted AAA+ superfamily ATPase
VLLAGPRQSGKTTLAEKFAADDMPFLTLDDQTTLDTARAAPAIGEVVVGADLVERILAGGYPEAIERSSWARRQKWFLDYVRAVIERVTSLISST